MKTKIRVLSAIMTVVMILSSLVIVIPTSVSAATTSAETWATHAATAFAGGKGTDADPYEIADAAQLAYLATLVTGAAKDASNENKYYSQLVYELTADIDATAYQWAPIGYKYGWNADIAFMGKFYGRGHTISTVLNDLTNWNKSSTAGSLLFGTLSTAIVEGVTLNATLDYGMIPKSGVNGVTSNVNNGTYGLFAGSMLGATTVTDCHVVMNVTGTTQNTKSGFPVGGFFGYVNSEKGVVDGCSLSGSLKVRTKDYNSSGTQIYAEQIQFGGFIAAMGGDAKSGTAPYTVKNCVNKADITLVGGGHQVFLSGLIGSFWSENKTIVEVENFVDISTIRQYNDGGTGKATSYGSYYLHYGSIVGRAKNDNYTQTIHMSGVVAAPTFKGMSLAGWTAGNASLANLMSSYTRKPHATNKFTVDNCFTANPAFPDVHTQSANQLAIVDAGTAKTLGGATNTMIDLDGVTAAKLSYAPDVENNKIVITVSKAFFDIFKSIDANATVTYGGIAATTVAESGDNYVFTVEGISAGGVGAIKTDLGTYTDNWTAYAEKPANGTGAAATPFEIATAGNLAYLHYGINNVISGIGALYDDQYKLTANIDLAHREWHTLGGHVCGGPREHDWCFAGVLDGNNFAITNLTQTKLDNTDNVGGLFGGSRGSTVKNLTLTGSIKGTLTSNSANAGVAMVYGGFTHATGKIHNVDVDANIEITNTVANPNVGGMLALDNNSEIKDSTMSGSIKVIAAKGVNAIPMAGGFIGKTQGVCSITNCINYADITLQPNATNSYAGGFVALGSAAPSTTYKNCTTISNCVNYGDVTVIKGLSGNAAHVRIGGFVGEANYGGSKAMMITDCANFGTISKQDGTGTSSYSMDEIIGYNDGPGEQTAVTTLPPSTMIANILSLRNRVTQEQHVAHTTSAAIYTINPNYDPNNAESSKWIKAVAADKDRGYALDITGEEYYFEAGTMEKDGKATISVSKLGLDLFLASHHTMTLTYNGKTIATDLSKATVSANGRAYEWTVEGESYKAGQKATISVVDPLGKNAPITSNFATWEGVYASTGVVDADGDGYYDIKTAGDLGYVARMANKVSTNGVWKSVKMEMLNDIDFAGAYFTAITRSHNDKIGFNGQFVGTKSETENYKILNISVGHERYVYNRSMFGKTQSGFVFKDVDFVNPRVIGASPDSNAGEGAASMTGGGLIAGSMYGDSLIENVNITGLSYNVSGANSYYGGVVGYMAHKDAIVRDVTVQGKVTGERGSNTAVNFGGITHRLRMGTIENCVVDLDIDVKFSNVTGNNYIGMIASHAYSNSNSESTTIKNNTALGTIKVTVTDGTGNASSKWVAYAGIVGFVHQWGAHTISGNVSDVDVVFNNKGADVNCVKAATVAVVNPRVEDSNKVAGVKPTIENNYSLNGLPIVHSANNAATIGTNSQWNVAVETEGKASVRIDKTSEANSGIRFDSYINSVLYNAMKADSNVQVEIGTLIAPTVLMKAYNGKFDQLPAVVKVAYDVDAYAAAGNGVEGFASIADGKSYFTGALVNVLPNNYKLEFTAVAYVTVTIHGVSHTYYAAYDANDEERARSIYDVALEAYNDREATYSAEYGTFVGDNAEKGNYSCYSTAQLNVLREYLGI